MCKKLPSAFKIIGMLLLIQALATCVIAKPPGKVRTYPLPGTVTLMFDNGPNLRLTSKILDILKKYNIHATFFIAGTQAKKYPKLIRRICNEGHTIGSHSLTYNSLLTLSDDELIRKIKNSKNILDKITKKPTLCFMTPSGSIDKKVEKSINRYGMKNINIFFDSFDYEKPGVNKIVLPISYHAKSGLIILLHDGIPDLDGQNQVIEALPKIIENIKAKGLGFSTICAYKGAKH